jgi:hypothetical protein
VSCILTFREDLQASLCLRRFPSDWSCAQFIPDEWSVALTLGLLPACSSSASSDVRFRLRITQSLSQGLLCYRSVFPDNDLGDFCSCFYELERQVAIDGEESVIRLGM